MSLHRTARRAVHFENWEQPEFGSVDAVALRIYPGDIRVPRQQDDRTTSQIVVLTSH
jgi:hypothetical protein